MQYIHNRLFNSYRPLATGGSTIAILPPSKEDLLKSFSSSEPSFQILVGKADCSSKDHYNKKIGRELAETRLNAEKFFIQKINYDQSRIYVTLVSKQYHLLLQLNANSDRVYVISCN